MRNWPPVTPNQQIRLRPSDHVNAPGGARAGLVQRDSVHTHRHRISGLRNCATGTCVRNSTRSSRRQFRKVLPIGEGVPKSPEGFPARWRLAGGRIGMGLPVVPLIIRLGFAPLAAAVADRRTRHRFAAYDGGNHRAPPRLAFRVAAHRLVGATWGRLKCLQGNTGNNVAGKPFPPSLVSVADVEEIGIRPPEFSTEQSRTGALGPL